MCILFVYIKSCWSLPFESPDHVRDWFPKRSLDKGVGGLGEHCPVLFLFWNLQSI